ncbi:helix-turn-helix domain-containing protein [Streptomyces sp. TLI_55]|uniref:helix-turn-helix domain-containing protein n=1 Tax=Streptomyces sp. TLI_55 TaxID=1938861 RepID=UPI00117D7B2E|nr:helix-turn-helix domain-containing protein [Streptomyces sp. TLI_55]
MAAEIRNELLIAFGRKLRALRVASGLSQSDLASPAAANFSIKTISAKERGVGTHAPEEPFVALYVQRCRDHKLRRGTVPASAYDPRAWETARTRLEDALFEARAPQPDDDADLAGHVEGPGTGPADVPSLAGPTAPAEAAGSGPTGRFRRLADWTPRAFGVQASVGNNRDSSPTTDAGPQYLARAFDQVLGTDLLYGHEVRPRCVALSGWSSVGKTRSAWAAATAVLPPTTLLARPEDARELLDLLAGPVPAGALVFLDDAARHLREPELHEVSVGLKALLQRREPVAVLLTVHPLTLRQLEELTDDPERDARAKLVLRLIERIHDVDEVLHDLTDARQAAKIDPQLRDALEAAADTGRVIPMLTGGPQLVSRLPRLEASTRALVLGATDCRRLGLTEPLNDALLADAAFGHLDPYERARTDGRWLPEALSAASRRVTGQVAALYPVNHTSVYQVQGYDVSPYLVHHRDRHQDAIPPRTWQALHDHVTNADQLILLGHAARSRTVFSWAHRYFTRAGQLGQQDADRALGELMEEVHWTAPDPAPESAPLPSAAPTTRTEARTEELSGIDMVLDELDDFDLGMTNYATIDPLLHDVVPPYTSYEIITNPPTLEISAKYTVEVVPDHPEIIAKLNIGDDWYTWYSRTLGGLGASQVRRTTGTVPSLHGSARIPLRRRLDKPWLDLVSGEPGRRRPTRQPQRTPCPPRTRPQCRHGHGAGLPAPPGHRRARRGLERAQPHHRIRRRPSAQGGSRPPGEGRTAGPGPAEVHRGVRTRWIPDASDQLLVAHRT